MSKVVERLPMEGQARTACTAHWTEINTRFCVLRGISSAPRGSGREAVFLCFPVFSSQVASHPKDNFSCTDGSGCPGTGLWLPAQLHCQVHRAESFPPQVGSSKDCWLIMISVQNPQLCWAITWPGPNCSRVSGDNSAVWKLFPGTI